MTTATPAFLHNNKGSSAVIAVVTSLIAIVIALLVGTLVLSKLAPKIVGTDAPSNDTIAAIVESAYGALDIAAILPYVVVAGAAIALVMYYMGNKQGQ